MAEDNNTTIDTPGGDVGTPDSLHDDISKAFDQVEVRDAPPGAGAEPPGHKPGAPAEAPAPGERLRDPATGKFRSAPDTPAKPPTAPAAAPGKPELAAPPKPPLPGQKPAQAAPAAPPPPGLKPPVSWKAGVREHWPKLPPEVQQEVIRRESEVARSMQESANARQALSHVQSVLGPYAHNIQATGRNALDAMGDLFRADNTLRHGTAQEKAALAADIIKSYGVDIATLDAILAGQQPTADPNAALADRLRREMQQQLQPVMQYFGQLQGRRESAIAQINTEAATEVDAFSQDAAHEFFDDVRSEMADIMDLYTARGVAISLQDAYDRAIKINPQVSEIIAKRAESERASVAAQAAQRARRTAAGSISSAPAPAGAAPGAAGDDRRSAIESAWNDQSQG